jgi:hypothetical protein
LLDHDRPLWRAEIVTGLPEPRFALLLVLSHILADGLAAVTLAGTLFDQRPDAAAPTIPTTTAARRGLAAPGQSSEGVGDRACGAAGQAAGDLARRCARPRGCRGRRRPGGAARRCAAAPTAPPAPTPQPHRPRAQSWARPWTRSCARCDGGRAAGADGGRGGRAGRWNASNDACSAMCLSPGRTSIAPVTRAHPGPRGCAYRATGSSAPQNTKIRYTFRAHRSPRGSAHPCG